jgi:di/tricarboxylate transporter
MITGDQIVVFLVLLAALGLFVWGRWRYDLVALGALLAVVLWGLVPADDAFAGFSHPAVVTVAAVLVLSKGLLNAGVVNVFARQMTRVGGGATVQIAALTLLTAVCSGFMNNVGALALLMPVAAWMARRGGYSPSQALMPLAFGSLLGGMTTLIGTPPNLIVASFRPESSGAPFGMFAFTPVGAAVTLAGVAAISLLNRWLVPIRVDAQQENGLFAIDEYVTELRVLEDSKVAGKTLHDLEASLGDDAEANVIALIRDGRKTIAPSAYAVLRPDDLLLVEATPEDIKTLMDSTKLELAESKDEGEGSLESDDVQLLEAVVGHGSPLLGRSVAELDLRQRFRVNLLAIARHGQQLKQQLSHIRFVLGDIVLLQGSDEALEQVTSELRCLPLEQRELPLGKRQRIPLAGGLFALGLAATACGLAPVQIALLSVALVMILVGIVSVREAYEAIDWPILVLLGAMMPVGGAFESTGAAELLAGQVARVADWGGTWLLLPALMVGTMLLSNVVNNAAAAVLMAPIAVRVAASADASPDALLMAVAVGASAAFLTPIGHQSNTLVMEPGGYRFGDYWPLGLVVSMIVVLIGTPMILLIWSGP